MNKAQAIHKFWSGFNLPAYEQYTVPDNAEMPYITYAIAESDFGTPVPLTASLWYRSQSWEDITIKSYEISDYISLGGKIIDIDNGKIWIYRGTPFSQRMSDTDDTVRRILINVVAEFFTTY